VRVRPSSPPDFIAQIWLDPDKRSHFSCNGLVTGFTALHDFHHPEGGVNDGLHFLINRDELPLGDVGESEVWLLCPERQSGRFFPGLEFDIYGGATLVGHGFITKVVNKHLAKRGSQAL
jgi:hypothetical protein